MHAPPNSYHRGGAGWQQMTYASVMALDLQRASVGYANQSSGSLAHWTSLHYQMWSLAPAALSMTVGQVEPDSLMD